MRFETFTNTSSRFYGKKAVLAEVNGTKLLPVIKLSNIEWDESSIRPPIIALGNLGFMLVDSNNEASLQNVNMVLVPQNNDNTEGSVFGAENCIGAEFLTTWGITSRSQLILVDELDWQAYGQDGGAECQVPQGEEGFAAQYFE